MYIYIYIYIYIYMYKDNKLAWGCILRLWREAFGVGFQEPTGCALYTHIYRNLQAGNLTDAVAAALN